MLRSPIAWGVAFSLAVHGLVLALALHVSGRETAAEEHVYRVALAEFSRPAEATVEPPEAEPSRAEPSAPPRPEAEPDVVPDPEPAPVPAPEPETQKISPKKDRTRPGAKKPAQPKPAPPQPTGPAGPASPIGPVGPVARNVDGIAAYDSDTSDQRPGITKRSIPEYPDRARRLGMEGSVVVELVVDTRGMPRNGRVVRARPQGHFEDSALRAVSRMRFSPGRLKGQPVNTVVHIPFEFRLR